jgi:hypothetical protein
MPSANPDRKIYRTPSFSIMKDGVEHIVYWSIDPSYFNAGKAYVRENDMDPKFCTSRVATDELPELEALRAIQKFEEDAAAKYPLTPPGHTHRKWESDSSAKAPHWQEHPAIEEDRTRQNQAALKAKKPSFKLK